MRASFVFVDVCSTNKITVVNRLNVRFFLCEETLIDSCVPLDVTIKDDLSATIFFKNYRVLERNSSSYTRSLLDPDTAFVAFSSGTTGDPKIIQIPFRSIIPNVIDLR